MSLPSLDFQEQQAYVNNTEIERLPLEPVAVIKTEKNLSSSKASSVHPKTGLTNLDGPIREVLAYELQEAIGKNFGVPATVLTNVKHPYFNKSQRLIASLQRFVKKGKTLCTLSKDSNFKDFSEYRFPKKEFEKFLLDICIFNTDYHDDNILVSKETYLKSFKIKAKIDHFHCLPNPDLDIYCLLKARLLWLAHEEANEKMSSETRELFFIYKYRFCRTPSSVTHGRNPKICPQRKNYFSFKLEFIKAQFINIKGWS